MQLFAVELVVYDILLPLNLAADGLGVFSKCLHFRALSSFHLLGHNHGLDFIEHVSSGVVLGADSGLVFLVGVDQFLYSFLLRCTFTHALGGFGVDGHGDFTVNWRHISHRVEVFLHGVQVLHAAFF